MILNQYEVFAVKAKSNLQYLIAPGNDVTLNCSISKLSSGITLQWKRDGSTEENIGNNTDLLQFNNTLYLIIKNADIINTGKYTCEIQWKGRAGYSISVMLSFSFSSHLTSYTLYRASRGNGELRLICRSTVNYSKGCWYWKPQHAPTDEKKITCAGKYKDFQMSAPLFENRTKSITVFYAETNYQLHITPIQFEDAGDYRCILERALFSTVKLITAQANASYALDKHNTVTLTCSVSDVPGPIKLAFVGNEAVVHEKHLTESSGVKSFTLQVQAISKDDIKWKCVVFHRDVLKVIIPVQLDLPGQQSHRHDVKVALLPRSLMRSLFMGVAGLFAISKPALKC
nr:PREDICTED: uncharacterized protein LOC106702952 [Latimeria chalumnae]|eukprot:XP_014342173.1 PREDICTED: uncharacterized protein LOC106702952 [Latimeria chalumnae]